MTTAIIPARRDLTPILNLALNAVPSPETKRKYQASLIDFISRSPRLDRAAVQAWKTDLIERGLSASTINRNLSAVRLLAREAALNGHLDAETAAAVEQIPNARISGNRRGNWLTQSQAQKLIMAPSSASLKGKRDRCALALLVGCGLRRGEAAKLTFEHIQPRDGRWVIADMNGKRGRIRTVPVPEWVKTALDEWSVASGVASGRILRGMDRFDNITHETLSDKAVYDIVTAYAAEIGVRIQAHDLRRTCAKLCRKHGGELEQIQLLLGHESIQTTERYLGTNQDLVNAPNDNLGLAWRE